ncbi:MAG: hypothetical protein ACKN9W_16210 [Methylococcus sp.]
MAFSQAEPVEIGHDWPEPLLGPIRSVALFWQGLESVQVIDVLERSLQGGA